jgi:glycosyltransferase involved in cell wall biosynthesis
LPDRLKSNDHLLTEGRPNRARLRPSTDLCRTRTTTGGHASRVIVPFETGLEPEEAPYGPARRRDAMETRPSRPDPSIAHTVLRPTADLTMHIVHVMTHLRLGAGRAVVDTAIEQAKQPGARVSVVLPDDANGNWRTDRFLADELCGRGIRVEVIGDYFHRRVAAVREAAGRLGRAVGPMTGDTVVHAHSAMGGVVGRWAGAPVVVATCHGWNLERPPDFDLQDALAFSLCDLIVSPSHHWAERVRALAPDTPVRVLANGFDLSRLPPLVRAGRRPDAPIRVICVGELTARKGQDVLIDAMPEVWRAVPAMEVHVFGDGDEAARLRARADAIDAGRGRLHVDGFVPDPYARLARYDIACLPSRSDNQPVALIEAMLAGLPIVATRVGGIPELIEDAGCGVIVEPGSPAALAQALRDVAGEGEAGWRALGQRGERFARGQFDVERTVAELGSIYAVARARRR